MLVEQELLTTTANREGKHSECFNYELWDSFRKYKQSALLDCIGWLVYSSISESSSFRCLKSEVSDGV